jgi:hypothetical protein
MFYNLSFSKFTQNDLTHLLLVWMLKVCNALSWVKIEENEA